jgi:tRNA threonylcarbamoyladenosine biosynthesis protein TsaB
MPYILNIDTALASASICISNDNESISFYENEKQRDHAAWLQPTIKKMLEETGIRLQDLGAIAVSNGPGSYTGLRIGLSSAKGLSYALNLPLIAISTLDMMAASASATNTDFTCPMIDARRMEVYTALYDKQSARIMEPQAMVLDASSFADILNSHTVTFFGSGNTKFRELTKSQNAAFDNIKSDARSLIKISNNRFQIKDFNTLAYTEPVYIKEFYTTSR